MMFRKMLALAVLLSAVSHLEGKTRPIGSVVARGELLVDGYSIKGSGTAFDGTVVETGPEAQSGADLLLGNGTRITLHSNSHGTLFRDHLILDRGEAEISASAPYRVQIDTLVVRTTESNSGARIAIGAGRTIDVFAKEGPLEVIGSRGEILSSIGPHKAQDFTRNGKGGWGVSDASHRGFHDDHRDDHDHDKGDHDDHGHHNHPHPSK